MIMIIKLLYQCFGENMSEKITRLINCLLNQNIEFRHIVFEHTTKTVDEAARVANTDPSNIVKTLILVDDKSNIYACIIPGDKRADIGKIKKILGIKNLSLASPEQVREKLGYEIGEVPPLCLDNIEKVIVDTTVLTREKILGGGGSVNSLIEFSPRALYTYRDKLVIADVAK